MEEELLGMSVEFLAQARAQRLDEAHSSMEDTCFGKENHAYAHGFSRWSSPKDIEYRSA
jgi:hypothetical protein